MMAAAVYSNWSRSPVVVIRKQCCTSLQEAQTASSPKAECLPTPEATFTARLAPAETPDATTTSAAAQYSNFENWRKAIASVLSFGLTARMAINLSPISQSIAKTDYMAQPITAGRTTAESYFCCRARPAVGKRPSSTALLDRMATG